MSTNSKKSWYNVTHVALDNGDTWTGLGESTEQYQGVYVNCESDQGCEMTLSWSNDNANWYWSDVVAITGGTAYTGSFINKGLYYRLSIENNSGTNMTRLTAMSRYINDVVDTTSMTVSGTPAYSATLWNAAAVVNGDTSSVADLEHIKHLDIVGESDAAVNLSIELSHDNSNWYTSNDIIIVPAAGHFHVNLDGIGARYLRLKSDATANVTAHVSGKG